MFGICLPQNSWSSDVQIGALPGPAQSSSKCDLLLCGDCMSQWALENLLFVLALPFLPLVFSDLLIMLDYKVCVMRHGALRAIRTPSIRLEQKTIAECHI